MLPRDSAGHDLRCPIWLKLFGFDQISKMTSIMSTLTDHASNANQERRYNDADTMFD
jgi:hypothetical protein